MAKVQPNYISLRVFYADNGYVIHHSESLERGTTHQLAIATTGIEDLTEVLRNIIINGMQTHD